MYLRYFLSSFVVLSLCVLVGCSNPEEGVEAPTTPVDAAQQADQSEAAGVAQAPSDPPEVVAEKFIQAGNAGDKETFVSLLTEKAREGFGDDATLGDDSGFESYTIGEATIEDDTATVAVDATDDGEPIDVTLRMRQEAAEWRVFAMDIDLGDGMVMKMDLEKLGGMLDSMAEGMAESMGESMATALGEGISSAFETSPEQIAAQRIKYESLRAFSEEEYEGLWKNTQDFKGQSSADALTALAAAIGLPLDIEGHEEALSAEVSADVTGLSNIEAIERIATDAGLYPLFPDPEDGAAAILESMASALAEGLTQMLEESGLSIEGLDLGEVAAEAGGTAGGALSFAAGPRPGPAVFTGPFVVEIAEVEENVPNTTGSLSLVVRAYGLDPALLALMENDSDSTGFEKIADAQGRPLIDEDIMYLGGGMSDGVRYTDTYTLELRNLIREVDAIATVSGVQRVQRPTDIVVFTFAEASEGATAEADGFSATIDSLGDYTQISVSTPAGFDTEEVAAVGKAEDGENNPLSVSYVTTMSWQEDRIDVNMNLDEAPAAIEVKLVTGMEIHEYPFAFSDIPLEHSADQPEKVEELSFDGAETPVTVEFLEITDADDSFGKIRVRVTNHSNKDAENVSLNLIYLDGEGNELDSFPAGLNVEHAFENGEMVSKPAVAKHAAKEAETTAFNMPEGTEEVRIEVTMVDFLDGTDWSSNM